MILRFVAAIALLLLSPSGLLEAQDLPATSPSGILVDRTLQMAHLEELDGRTEGAVVTLPRFRQALFELQQSSSVDLGWKNPRALARHALSKASRDTIPLALLYSAYDRLDAEQKLRSGEVFALAPLQDKTYYGRDLRFILQAADILRHGTGALQELRLDAGDGLGFRSLIQGTELKVSYAGTGSKILRLQASLADGTTLESRARLDVVQLTTPDPTETWPVTASESWLGVAGTGQAYVYLAEGHSQLTNPVVVVEGFDIDNSIDWPVLYDLLNRENMLEDLRDQGYDAVVLDFTEAVDPIERNAFVLTSLLEMINAATPPSTTSALVGASMGGLVARYGLLWMEQHNIPHQVRNFISFDAPHNGANIPLGLQEWLVFFAGQAEEAAYLITRLNAPASRQMLLYHQLSTVGTTANPDPLKAALDLEFTNLGGWPEALRRVSVINGSGLKANQGFSAGDQIILYDYSTFLISLKGNVWAVPMGVSQMIFDGKLTILFSTTSKQLTVSGTLPWDNAPGGSRATMEELASVAAPYGDIVALHNAHSFIPTVSALALASNDPFYDVAGDVNLLQHTPFDQVYYPAANQEHIEITPENKLWFMAEINFEEPDELIFSDGFEF